MTSAIRFWSRQTSLLSLLAMVVGLSLFQLPVQAMPPSPELVQQLKQSGQLDAIIQRLAAAKAKGVDAGIPGYYNPKTSPNQALAARSAPDTFRVVVILADFSDNPASGGSIYAQPSDFQNLLFSDDSTDNHYSMTEFYYENSYGKFYLQGTVVGWLRLPQTYAYYVNNDNGFGSYPNNAQRMAEDAITLADPLVDFSQFDNDGNGWCDGVFIVHAGAGAEQTGSSAMIWSHSWSTSYTMHLDGINVQSYTTEPEEFQGLGLITMGVFCHEYGHFLGLPDLYDTDYSSAGIGDWSLMAGGSWNYSGRYPAFFDAWCKKELGFLTPTNMTANQQDVQIPESIYNPVAYRVWENGTVGNEYFLIENRQKTGNDPGIPGSGLLIFHVDESVGGNTNENHPLLAVMQADGRLDLQNNVNQGDGGDVWSTLSQTEFSDLSVPNTRKYNGNKTRTSVWNISAPDSIMTANLDINYSRPRFELVTSSFSDSAFGNGNGVVEPGETITFKFSLLNQWEAATNVTGTLSSDNLGIVFGTPSVNLGSIAAEGGTANNFLSPLSFTVPQDFDPCIDSFFLEITCDNPLGTKEFGMELHIGTPQVLVVDDDNGDNWQEAVTTSLNDLRLPYDVYDKSVSGSPTAAQLENYRGVIWLTGSDRPNILSSADVTAMEGFMDNGGNLFLTGQSIVGQLSSSNPSFVSNYLKVSYVNDQLFPILNGELGSDIGNGIKVRYASGTNQSHPQNVTPLAGANTEFTIPTGGVQGISYAGTYRLVLFSFGFEGISDLFTTTGYSTKDTVMARIADYLNMGGDVNALSNPYVDTVTIAGEAIDHVVNTSPTFEWTTSDTTGGSVTQYQVQVGSGGLCSNSSDMWDTGIIPGSPTSIAYSGLPLESSRTYFVRVRVYDGSDWSSWRRIRFHMNGVAAGVTLSQPAEKQMMTSATPQLTVNNAADPDGDPLTYDFEVFTDSLLTNLFVSTTGVASGSGTTSWTVSTPLTEDQQFFWRSRAFDGYQYTPYSSARSFYVNAVDQAPNSFGLTMPADSSAMVGTSPTFVWHTTTDPDPGDAVTYTLWVSEDSTFATYTEAANLTDTTHTFGTALNDPGHYYWRVKAVDLASTSTWSSETFDFYTGAAGCCIGMRGNVNGDSEDVVDITDLIYLVDYSFGTGPAPACDEEADVNGDGAVDIGDVIYLVDYSFGSGPAPVACP